MKNTALFIALFLTILSSCVSEDYFGRSPYGYINNIEISNQASQAQIDAGSMNINIQFPPGVALDSLMIQVLDLSTFAVADKNVGEVIDLSQSNQIVVTAEDGSLFTWQLNPLVASSTPQLDNSDFNQWYQSPGGYMEPGADASSTIWGTGNPGTQILGLLATTPYEIADGNNAVQMETLDNGKLAATFGTPISAGSIFTGVFDSDAIDPSNPEAAIHFGTPFTGRPASFNLKYSYTPGEVNKDKGGNVLEESDQCDIYALLEIRTQGGTERLATAWFRSPDPISASTNIEVEFTYGPLDNSFPAYMFPEDARFVSADSAAFVLPTHITFVATSSWNGANFGGAIGSKLFIDDLELIYK